RTALREELISSGELVPVEVENVRGTRFVVKAEVALLEHPPEPAPSVGFLPPFDPLVWDRVLLGSLFEFDYVWELFVPPAKRRWRDAHRVGAGAREGEALVRGAAVGAEVRLAVFRRVADGFQLETMGVEPVCREAVRPVLGELLGLVEDGRVAPTRPLVCLADN